MSSLILTVSGHQADFILLVGSPNYPQSYNFSADYHIFTGIIASRSTAFSSTTVPGGTMFPIARPV